MLCAQDSAGNITIGSDGEPKPVFRCFNYYCLQDAWNDVDKAKKRRNQRNSRLAKKRAIREAGEAVGNSECTRSVRSERRGPCGEHALHESRDHGWAAVTCAS